MNNRGENTKRIVTNTIVLYIRMFVVMLITLYSSRIVLKALGVDDFGLFNVVGGVVAMMTFLKSSLASSTQRFLSFEIGRNDIERTKAVFTVSLTTHVVISIVILILAETIGLWFLNAKINIPEGRVLAANIIYQLSVLSLIIGMIAVPYNADIISHERMSFYAIVGIFEAVLKLGFALLLLVFNTDRLILYGILTTVLNVLVSVAYWLYCNIKFDEAKFRLSFDKKLFSEIFSFSGWTILGQMAVVAVSYGTGIIINLFFPLVVNAAMGIAQQVNSAITGLTGNFQTAFQPQITKSYASKDFSYLSSLVHYSSKISFFLLFIVTLPIMLNIDFILKIWLTTVPIYTNAFCVFFLIASILNAISAPLWISIFATGRIKIYQIVVSLVFFSDLIIVYFLFKLGLPPVTCMVVKVVINFIVIFVRLLFARKEVECFSALNYLRCAFFPCMLSAIITLTPVIPLIMLADSFLKQILVTIFAIALSLVVAYYVGLNKDERLSVNKMVFNVIHKRTKHE